ncbi:MAG: hypothetical protein ACLTMM_08685 [Lachnospiraceae bacterium]|nr:hypothetical protein [Acutalibacteraceae bacterium]
MADIIISQQHQEAVETHQRIITSANLAQQNLWDMCTSLKQMRDDKLYKELGYQSFEAYCETEVGIKRRNAYNYISIVEKINPENVQSIAQIGITKLALLATVSESEQAEIAEKLDLEDTTVKQLKAEIERLKDDNLNLSMNYDKVQSVKIKLSKENSKLEIANGVLREQVEELESRPVEVAEPSDNERRLNETIKALERENIKHYDELEAEYRNNEKIVRKQLEDEKQEALRKQKEEYEERLQNVQTADGSSDDKDVFKAYFSIAYDSFIRMLDFAKQSQDKDFFKSKIEHLIEALAAENINL